jgi:hypothetical protein
VNGDQLVHRRVSDLELPVVNARIKEQRSGRTRLCAGIRLTDEKLVRSQQRWLAVPSGSSAHMKTFSVAAYRQSPPFFTVRLSSGSMVEW